MFEQRDGEIRWPTIRPPWRATAHVVFIGRIRSPWLTREDCPKNMARRARNRHSRRRIEIDAAYRPGLAGLAGASHSSSCYLAGPRAAESDCPETAPCR